MTKHRKTKVRTKVIYRQKPESTNYESQAKKDIEELEAKRLKNIQETEKMKEGKKGFDKFLIGVKQGMGRASINQQISAKRNYLQGTQQVRNLKTQAEAAKIRTELAELHKKNTITFNDLQGMGSSSKVKFEDLY